MEEIVYEGSCNVISVEGACIGWEGGGRNVNARTCGKHGKNLKCHVPHMTRLSVGTNRSQGRA